MSMKRRVGFGAFPRALAAGLQWKLLLLWFVFTLIPALVAARPLHAMLAGLMDHSVHADAWARHFNGLAMTDTIVNVMRHGGLALGAAAGLGLILTLLLAPFLTGMSVVAVRSAHRPGFGELMHGGLHEYWRLFRFMIWGFGLMGFAFGLGGLAMAVASRHAKEVVLQSQADLGNHLAMLTMVVLLVLAHSMVEAGRGQIVADAGLRSATTAFFRGMATLFRRPLSTLGMYLGVTVIGFIVWGLLGFWRTHLVAASWGGYALAFVATLLIVAAMAWMRTARLAAFGAVAHACMRSTSVTVAPA
jgi:hypothetical protein